VRLVASTAKLLFVHAGRVHKLFNQSLTGERIDPSAEKIFKSPEISKHSAFEEDNKSVKVLAHLEEKLGVLDKTDPNPEAARAAKKADK